MSDPRLPPAAAGLRVRTASGTAYLLDRESRSVRRLPGRAAPELRRDSEPIQLLHWPAPVIGWPMVLALQVRDDGLVTLRITTAVTSIETVGPLGAPSARKGNGP